MALYARDLYQMEKRALAVLRLRVFLAWLRRPLENPCARSPTRPRARPAPIREEELMLAATEMEHSPTGATGSGWERTPWLATQRAAWGALRDPGTDGPGMNDPAIASLTGRARRPSLTGST
jgi:hypothetical protein